MSTDFYAHRICFHGDLDQIGRLRGVRRYWATPHKHPDNPIMRAGQTPYEEDDTAISPHVMYDPESDSWRLWYCVTARPLVGDCLSPLAMATSTDGITWERPKLGLIEHNGSRENNLVYVSEGKAVSGPGILFDPEDADPSRRYKLFYCTQEWNPQTGNKTASDCRVAFSPDGINWQPFEQNPVLNILSDTRHCLCRDRSTGRYVCCVRLRINAEGKLLYRHGDPITADDVRCVGRIESEDFIHWTEPELIIAPGPWTTAGDQYYGLTAFAYEGAFLGLLQVFHRYAPNFGYSDEQLVYSEDSRHWQPIGDTFFLPAGPAGTWDAGWVDASAHVVVLNDHIRFYYRGSNRSHGGGPQDHFPHSLGLATLRRDGFAFLKPPAHEGTFASHPFSMRRVELRVNADASVGRISAAILGSEDRPLEGYTHEDCQSLRQDSIEQVMRWTHHNQLPVGKALRLELRLRDAALYSLWLKEPDT